MAPRHVARPGLAAALILAAILVGGDGSVRAAIQDPFNGYADLAAVQARVNGLDQESLREDYHVGFDQRLLPYLDLRLAYRYYHFDQEVDLALGSYRKEVQPSGELRWNHPLFLASTSLFRREVEVPESAPILTNSLQALFKTRSTRYPLLEIRYDSQHTWDDLSGPETDIRNRRLQAHGSWDKRQHQASYTFSHTESENIITDLKSDADRHLLRWAGTGRRGVDDRMQLSGNYTFSHTTQTDEVRAGGSVLRTLPVLQGLHSLDDAPDFGVLEPAGGLADGNTAAPAFPNIDIGGSNTDHNLGADLGSERPVGALYVHTDRPAGSGVVWSVWGSADNLTWDLVSTAPSQVFNPALNRYELTLFAPAAYRYVKVVNGGLNEVALVLVTEFEVLESISNTAETGLQYVSHQFDGRVGYRFNDRWRGATEVSLQVDELPGREGDRTRGSLGARAGFDPSPTLSHNARWEVAAQRNEKAEDVTDHMLGYTLVSTPLETLRGSLSVNDRFTWLGGKRSQHMLSSAVEANADLLAGLLATVGLNASRSEDFLGDRRFTTWSARTRIQTALTRGLDLVLDGSYLESLETVRDDLRKRRDAGLGVDWRVTRDLYFRGSLRQTSETSDRVNVDALLSWNILPALRVSAQHDEIRTDDLTTTLRRSVNLNWELTARSNIYVRLAEVDLSGGGGTRTTSFQQGFRIGF